VISNDAAFAFAVVFATRVAFAEADETAEGAAPMRHTSPMSTLTTRLFNVFKPRDVWGTDSHGKGHREWSQAQRFCADNRRADGSRARVEERYAYSRPHARLR